MHDLDTTVAESVDQVTRVLDEIAREFGSTIDELSQDKDLRRYLARQLVFRGIVHRGAPADGVARSELVMQTAEGLVLAKALPAGAVLVPVAAILPPTAPVDDAVVFVQVAGTPERLLALDDHGQLWLGEVKGAFSSAGQVAVPVRWDRIPSPTVAS